jgi:type II secretory pathway predicted ATPase ExeA
MYESFFGFAERPFAATPVVERYFAGADCETARETLARCVERAEGTGLLIGPAGTGKTLLCQVLGAQFSEGLNVAILASGQLTSRRALFQAILYELGLPFRGMEESELRLSLVDYLSPRGAIGELPDAGMLLIIDEAHTLPLRLLDELRLLTNLTHESQPRVRVLLAGGPQLEERLASPKLDSFNQRIAARCYLHAFNRQQTADYVRYEIECVHGDPAQTFAADAYSAIYQATDGIPRLINQVCDHALLLAYAGGVFPVAASGIQEAWSDLQQLPTPWSSAERALSSAGSGSVVEFGSLDSDAHDSPAAIPIRAAGHAMNTLDPLRRIDSIQDQLAEIDDEFHPAGSIQPEVELVFQSLTHPFEESFDEEEIVIDPYTAIETDALADRPLVRSAESRELSALLTPHVAPQKPAVGIASATWPGGSVEAPPTQTQPRVVVKPVEPKPTPSQAPLAKPQPAATSDDDMIVIEDPPERIVAVTKKPAPRVRRQEYRQLFAQLRRG